MCRTNVKQTVMYYLLNLRDLAVKANKMPRKDEELQYALNVLFHLRFITCEKLKGNVFKFSNKGGLNHESSLLTSKWITFVQKLTKELNVIIDLCAQVCNLIRFNFGIK